MLRQADQRAATTDAEPGDAEESLGAQQLTSYGLGRPPHVNAQESVVSRRQYPVSVQSTEKKL